MIVLKRLPGVPPRKLRLVIWAMIALGLGVWLITHERPRPYQPDVPNRTHLRAPHAEVVAILEDDETPSPVGTVTFAADVAPILQDKCAACHRPGQVAPFSLLTYDDACRRSQLMVEAVTDRRMPPWHADPRYGHFANNRGLSARQRAVLLAWVDQKTPLGDPAAIPSAKTFTEGWVIGQPDVVLTMPKPFMVPAQGVLSYQKFVVDTHFSQDVWIQAAEAKPGDRQVVHHVCVFLEKKVPNEEGHPERPEIVCYAPGDMPSIFPEGTAKKIPAGAKLIIEVHYTPIGVARPDQSSVGFVFAKGAIERKAVTKGISCKNLSIPPGIDDYEARSSFTFPFAARLLSLSPHMHLRGKDFRYTATYPDGHTEVVLSVPAYDFAWQSVYRLETPKSMPKGTRIDCLAHFDNSSKNMNNPDVKATVKWGDQTWDEMMIGYIDYDVLEAGIVASKPKQDVKSR